MIPVKNVKFLPGLISPDKIYISMSNNHAISIKDEFLNFLTKTPLTKKTPFQRCFCNIKFKRKIKGKIKKEINGKRKKR